MNIVNIYENCNSYFNADLKAIFERCSKIASQEGFKMYLIGGIVRDMLLETHVKANEIAASRENLSTRNDADIDITVEGNAIEFANILSKKMGAKILSLHQNFGTAKIEIEGQKIDFASTRGESYPRAGHLPHVDEIGCPLKKDVLRRDFTVNSLAMSLNQENFAQLIDYVGGFEDLKNKTIKILHDKSFIDDPTRIIRALKYSTRLGFNLDKKTLKLQEEYLANINYDMCYKRVKQEIKKTFEQNSQEAFDKFIAKGVYKLISSCRLGFLPQQYNIEKLVNKYSPKHYWFVYLGTILVQIPDGGQGGKLCPPYNLNLTKYEKEVIEGAESLKDITLKNDFEIYKAFSPQKTETLLILAALGKEKEVCNYLDNLAKVKLHINGNDLIKLGFKPSKKISEIFDIVLKEKLKNPKMTKTEELKIAQKYL